MTQVTQPNLDV